MSGGIQPSAVELGLLHPPGMQEMPSTSSYAMLATQPAQELPDPWLSDRLRGLRIAELHASLIIRGFLPSAPLACTLSRFRSEVAASRGPFSVRHFSLDCIGSVSDYAELAARMVHASGLDLDQLRVLEPLEGGVELRLARAGLLLRFHWVQRGAAVHPAFFEAIDALTMPQGRFVRLDDAGDRYLGLHLPAELAARVEALLEEVR